MVLNRIAKLIASVIVVALFVGILYAIGFLVSAIIHFSTPLYFSLLFGLLVALTYNSIDDSKGKKSNG